MIRSTLAFSLASGVLAGAPAPSARAATLPTDEMQPASFVVVVHAASPVQGLAAHEVAAVFLRRKAHWDDGSAALPVDQSMTSSVRRDFSTRLLDMSLDEVAAFWQEQIFSGRSTPPKVRSSDAEVLDFVRSHEGAVGYVAAGSPLPAGVRALSVH